MVTAPNFSISHTRPSKEQLRSGIYRWVKARVEGAAYFKYLDQLSYEDMMLFARAMGYDGPGSEPLPERIFEVQTPKGPVLVDTGAPNPDDALPGDEP